MEVGTTLKCINLSLTKRSETSRKEINIQGLLNAIKSIEFK